MARKTTLLITLILGLFLCATPVGASAESLTLVSAGAASDSAGAAADAAEPLVVAPATAEESPQNGIPLVVVYIDESADAIAAANAADGKHVYGTIDEMNASQDHSVRCIGSVGITVPDGYAGEYGSNAVPGAPLELKYIRGRGNSTWEMGTKKPYKIEFKEKADLFGMGKSKEWALLANDMDRSLIRNRAALWVADQMGMPYTPQLVPVDVVMVGMRDGQEVSRTQLGSYCLSEIVKVEKSRLDIDKLEDDVTSEDAGADPNITGGYLLSLYLQEQNADDPESTVFESAYSHQGFINRTPEFESEDLTEGQRKQRSYIRSYIDELDGLIMGEGDIDATIHDAIASMMDLGSLADFWWMQEFTCNIDGFLTSSNYLYKPRGGKLCWGPAWDFDMAWDAYGGAEGFNHTSFVWTDRLRESDPLFVETLKEHWTDPEHGMDAKLEELTRAGGTLDRFRDGLVASWVANGELWGDGGGATAEDFAERVDAFRDWIEARRAWIGGHLDEVGLVSATVSYLVDGQPYVQDVVRRGGNVDAPDAPEKSGYVFKCWINEETGEEFSGEPITDDMVFVAEYVVDSADTLPTKLYLGRYEEWVNVIFGAWGLPAVEVAPESAIMGTVEWSSSDPDVAYVDVDRIVLVGVGDVTLTATLRNGVSSSYVLHVYDATVDVPASPTGVTVTPELALEVGQMDQVRYAFETNGQPVGRVFFDFESSDESVAEVDGSGVVRARGVGEATVTLTVTNPLDEDFEPLTATCKVTVSEKKSEPQGGGSDDEPEKGDSGSKKDDSGSKKDDKSSSGSKKSGTAKKAAAKKTAKKSGGQASKTAASTVVRQVSTRTATPQTNGYESVEDALKRGSMPQTGDEAKPAEGLALACASMLLFALAYAWHRHARACSQGTRP